MTCNLCLVIVHEFLLKELQPSTRSHGRAACAWVSVTSESPCDTMHVASRSTSMFEVFNHHHDSPSCKHVEDMSGCVARAGLRFYTGEFHSKSRGFRKVSNTADIQCT